MNKDINITEIEKNPENFKIIKKLNLHEIKNHKKEKNDIVISVMDTETTGIEEDDEIFEFSGYKILFNEITKEIKVIDKIQYYRKPSKKITEEITKITGVTQEFIDNIDESIQPDIEKFVQNSEYLLFHNADFDTKKVEKLFKIDKSIKIICSYKQFRWSEFNFESAKLKYILYEIGYFHKGHNAIEDSNALLKIIDYKTKENKKIIEYILEESKIKNYIIKLKNTDFNKKEIIKERYKNKTWNSKEKIWEVIIKEDDLEKEIIYISKHIYCSNNINVEIIEV